MEKMFITRINERDGSKSIECKLIVLEIGKNRFTLTPDHDQSIRINKVSTDDSFGESLNITPCTGNEIRVN